MGTIADKQRRLSDPLNFGAIEALVNGRHGAPFEVLGPHSVEVDGQPMGVIRAFVPGAVNMWVVVEDPLVAATAVPAAAPAVADQHDGATTGEHTRVAEANHAAEASTLRRLPMRQLRREGLFSLLFTGEAPKDYRLETQRADGSTHRFADPYAFPALLSDYDLYLLGEGNQLRLYDHLGSHPRTVNGIDGVAFAVWAPNARRMSVVGDFNGWDDRAHPMRMRSNGIWELFIPDISVGALYKYAVLSWNRGYRALKADPLAFAAEVRPGTASRVWDLRGYVWQDDAWLREREERNSVDAPISVYEMHVGSWRPDPTSDGRQVTYRSLAHQLAPYLKEMGYTHVELMPIAEYPFDGSWGYQETGYFAPTSRYGAPQDFMYFVDYLHQHGIGVILDWVPAHFPKDEHGLAHFDGSHLYEHEDPRLGEHPDWGTLVFNYGRNEVRNFLISNALYWFDVYHVDGLRVDAVASMLYLDYSRREGEWRPNEYGGRENLMAIDFLRRCNTTVHERFPHAMTIAEESTAWPHVTRPASEGGLGFTFKWNMGWMHDILDYFQHEPVHRQYHQNEMTFSFVYAFSERYMLPFSHDEVVHLKGSMLSKMPGDHWQKFANLRALYTFMYGHPGKKLLFMGQEFGQWGEWNHAAYLDWALLDERNPDVTQHRQLRDLVSELNQSLRQAPALHERDSHPSGFEWIDGGDAAQSVVSFARWGADGRDLVVVVGNFTPVPRYNYRIGAPRAGRYVELINSDAERFGGSGVGNGSWVGTQDIPMHGRQQSLSLTLPPLATMLLRYVAE